MPTYEYKCEVCGGVSDQYVAMSQRLDRQNCPRCAVPNTAIIQMSAPLIGTEVRRGESRVIRDERQVTSELGPRWRDKGTTGKVGGAGKRIFFD